jgi:hypothetical protein
MGKRIQWCLWMVVAISAGCVGGPEPLESAEAGLGCELPTVVKASWYTGSGCTGTEVAIPSGKDWTSWDGLGCMVAGPTSWTVRSTLYDDYVCVDYAPKSVSGRRIVPLGSHDDR